MDNNGFSRRFFLRGAAVLGCSAAAHPFMNSMTFASAPGEGRLVVIILRGAMDGLDVVQPLGDNSLRQHRKILSGGKAAGAHDLNGFFAAHKNLGPLMPLWAAGELAFVHATSTPYRDKRSHFDGQDLLEAGTGGDVDASLMKVGWLNRLLQELPGSKAETAFSVGLDDMRILAGPAPALSWAPAAKLRISSQAELLLGHIYHDDPLFRGAVEDALQISNGGGAAEMSAGMTPDAGKPSSVREMAYFAADQLNGETRIATFSLTGWDTHRGQPGAIGASLNRLSEAILGLRERLGENWSRTTVMAMTEFGRTVRENGTQGTDHGTGGAMVLAGGAIRGAKVYGGWPGLGEGDLYDDRDLMPLTDVRAWAAWAMRAQFGVERSVLERSIFPGLDLGDDPKFML
jgi:uncharacterized protein (DUF1501 family)